MAFMCFYKISNHKYPPKLCSAYQGCYIGTDTHKSDDYSVDSGSGEESGNTCADDQTSRNPES